MIMLKEDLEWNDDLNDDMFNEIQRFERNVEREREENERFVPWWFLPELRADSTS